MKEEVKENKYQKKKGKIEDNKEVDDDNNKEKGE